MASIPLNFEQYNSLQKESMATEASIHSRQSSRSSSMTGSISDVPKSGTSKPDMQYIPSSGMFESTAPKTKTKKDGSQGKSAGFSSMHSSINRPKGSVFKRALFNVGYPTKESRLLQAAQIGDAEEVSGFLASGADPNWANEHGETALTYAAWRGHEAVVATLLHHPATHVNRQDNAGWTALMWAAKAGYDGVVRLFLVHPDTEPDLTNKLGETALMKASVHGHTKVVKLLTSSYRTTVDKKHTDGSTALLWAAAGGSIQCVSILLDANADIDACDADGMDSLMWAVSVGHADIVEFLIQKGCNLTKKDKVGRTPLLMAAEVGHAEVASFLLNHDDTDVNCTTKDRISALMRAAYRGHSPLVNMLIKCKDIDVNQQDSQGKTALIYAARSGQALCVSILLQHSAIDCNKQDNEGYTACATASNYGHDEALDALLKCSSVDLKLQTKQGLTALSLAARSGHKTVVKTLLAHPDIEINDVDGQGLTALSWAARQGSVLVVELLQQYQTLEPNKPDDDGLTALMWAARRNELLVVQTLLRDPRVDPIAEDNNGKTALDHASESGFIDVIHFLRRYQDKSVLSSSKNNFLDLENKSYDASDDDEFHSPSVIAAGFDRKLNDANVDTVSDVNRYLENGPFVNWRPKSGKTSFSWAVACGQTEVVKVFLLVPNLNVNETDNEGLTPLMIAASNGHYEVVRLLLTHEKTDINRDDPRGKTALIHAATNSHLRSLSMLLCCPHIDVNKKDGKGYTALAHAADIGAYEITRELLRHPDTKINVKTEDGATALLLAIRAGNEDVAELLLERRECDVNAMDSRGESALLLAAGHQGSGTVTSKLLQHPAIKVNLRAPAGHSALLLSAKNDHLECLRMLLDDQNIDVNLQDVNGMTALMFASEFGHEDMVRVLFSHPATDPNLRCKENGSTALILAARNNRPRIIEILAARNNVLVNLTDDFGATALNHIIRRNSREALYALLERPDIDVNIADAEGKTPLLRACSDGHFDIGMILLARTDVDVNRQTLEGRTALMYAAQMPEGLAALRLMLAIKAVDVNAADEHGSSALLHACKSGNVDAVAAILESCSMVPSPDGRYHLLEDEADDQGYTPLMWATLLGFNDIVRLLLQVRGLQPNTLTPDGLSALGLACECGHVDVVQTLTSHPAVDVNAGSEHGRGAPLVAALERYQHECVRILLQHPTHSLSQSGVRAPYLPPALKASVDLYNQHSKPRSALVLSSSPPSLLVDGGAKGGKGTSLTGATEVGSALLQLPRPFQVVQHEIRSSSAGELSAFLQTFNQRLHPSSTLLVHVSGEFLITPYGPALLLPPKNPLSTPPNVLLSSLLSILGPSSTLLVVLDVLGLHMVPSMADGGVDALAHALPPLVHSNMAVVLGAGGRVKKVFGSRRGSLFTESLCPEILHGVTLQQLHQRTIVNMRRKTEERKFSDADQQRQDRQKQEKIPAEMPPATEVSSQEEAQLNTTIVLEGSANVNRIRRTRIPPTRNFGINFQGPPNDPFFVTFGVSERDPTISFSNNALKTSESNVPISLSNKNAAVFPSSNNGAAITFGNVGGTPLPPPGPIISSPRVPSSSNVPGRTPTRSPVVPAPGNQPHVDNSPIVFFSSKPSSPNQGTLENGNAGNNGVCLLEHGLAFFNGNCSRLLSRSSCSTDQWLVLSDDGTPYCADRSCPWERLDFQGDCVDPASHEVCPRGQILYVDFNGQAECDCEVDHIYDPDSGHCYTYHEQGPCDSGFYLEQRQGGGVQCVRNPCDQDDKVLADGECYDKNYKGYCRPELVMILPESNSADCMFIVPHSIFEVPTLSACPDGSRRDFLGKCRAVFRVPTQTSLPSLRGECPTGFVSDPSGTCRKVVRLFG